MIEEVVEEVPTRLSATVLMLRDGRDGVEVYMQKRHAEMSSAASAHIFPGGSMDERDSSDESLRLLREVDLRLTAGRMGLGTDEAGLRRCGGLHVCAVREVAEETGVVLAPKELTYVAHFLTPVGLPRRYDTHFFVAPAPPGQEAAVIGGEASGGGWYSSAAVLAASGAGEVTLMPPTRILCAELGRHRDVAAVIAGLGTRPVPAILFRLSRVLGGALPDHLPSVEEVAAMEASG